MDLPKYRISSNRLDINFDLIPPPSRKPQELKLYNMATFPQILPLLLIVGLTFKSLITNLTSIASSFN